MVHPSDGEAWKHFNSVHPHFSVKSRNVHLRLCTDGFNPFGSFAALLSMIIPGPSNPGWNIDVCLRPLIDKLTQLWSSRALTYDISRK